MAQPNLFQPQNIVQSPPPASVNVQELQLQEDEVEDVRINHSVIMKTFRFMPKHIRKQVQKNLLDYGLEVFNDRVRTLDFFNHMEELQSLRAKKVTSIDEVLEIMQCMQKLFNTIEKDYYLLATASVNLEVASVSFDHNLFGKEEVEQPQNKRQRKK